MSEYLSMEDIQDFGTQLPLNTEFDAKLINVEDKLIKEEYPAIVATFEVLSGPQRGLTTQKTYWVEIRRSKAGKLYSRGLSNIKSDAQTLGVLKKLPEQFEFPVNLKAVKLAYHKAFAGAKLRILVEEQSYENKDKETKTKKEVIILPGVTSSHTVNEAIEEESVV